MNGIDYLRRARSVVSYHILLYSSALRLKRDACLSSLGLIKSMLHGVVRAIILHHVGMVSVYQLEVHSQDAVKDPACCTT